MFISDRRFGDLFGNVEFFLSAYLVQDELEHHRQKRHEDDDHDDDRQVVVDELNVTQRRADQR